MSKHAEALSRLRTEQLEILAAMTTINVKRLRAIAKGEAPTMSEEIILDAFA